jgi:hypothetical protein
MEQRRRCIDAHGQYVIDEDDFPSLGLAHPHLHHFIAMRLRSGSLPICARTQRMLCLRRYLQSVLGHLHSHLADVAQGGGPETALQAPPWVFFAPIHHALQSKVSGCPRSFVCGWIMPLPGLDSISIWSLWQASPKNRPLGRPARVTPIWHPATPGLMPSESFQYVVTFPFQSLGLNSIVP